VFLDRMLQARGGEPPATALDVQHVAILVRVTVPDLASLSAAPGKGIFLCITMSPCDQYDALLRHAP
jgi:hypothetical protein